MFHLVFSGNEQRANAFVAALNDAGHPAQICTGRAGLDAELLVSFVEAIAGDDFELATAAGAPVPVLELAAEHGFQLRLHGPIAPPRTVTPDPGTIAALEARIAALEGTR